MLGLFPHRRATGRVAIDDGRTVVARSFASLELRHPLTDREARLELEVGRAIHRFQPALVAIGIDERRPSKKLVRAVARIVEHLRVPYVTVSTQRVTQAMLGDSPPAGYDKLAQAVTGRLPGLAARVETDDSSRAAATRRRLAPAWRACAAALDASARRLPKTRLAHPLSPAL